MSNDALVSLTPLDEYLLQVFNKFISSKDFAFDRETTKRFDGSLTLVNYKPMVASSFENSPGYMPFVLEISTANGKNPIKNPEDIEIKYGEFNKEKTIHLNLGSLSKVINGYGFSLYEKRINVGMIQGATSKDFVVDVIKLYPTVPFGSSKSEEEKKSAEAKVNALIQTLESTNPTIRKDFYITYTIYTSSSQALYPHVILIPKGIINDISDFLLSQYQQVYNNVAIPPAEFIPNEEVESPELVEFLSNEKLPLEVVGKAVRGTYGSYPALLLPEGDYSQYLKGNERVINLGKNVLIVFGNPQGTPQPQQSPQRAPAPQVQEQRNKAEQNAEQIKEENNLEKTLNIELSPYIPDWLKFYLNKYGVMKGESLSKKEREVFAEKVWDELQKNWDKILELLDVKNASILPTTVLALEKQFPSEYKGSKKQTRTEQDQVIEETIRSISSNIFENIRTKYLVPLENSYAPDEIFHLRILRPMAPDEFERFLNELSYVTQLYRDAYLIFSFADMFENKSREQVRGADLKEPSPEKLKYIQDLVDGYKRLRSAGFYPTLIVDANNTLLVGSLKGLWPNDTYSVIKINDFDLSTASEEQLKRLKSFLDFIKNAFDDQYGTLILRVTMSPSVLDMEAFRSIVKLIGICSEKDEACVYKARQELSAFPENLKDTFINNLADIIGKGTSYRTKYLSLFATLIALVNYYSYLSELKKQEMTNKLIRKLRKEEEEKARNALEKFKQNLNL